MRFSRIVTLAALLVMLVPAFSSAGQAGWQKAETKHFIFIYEPRDRAYVDELLTFAEDVYDKVTQFLDSRPTKVPCVIRGRRDDANGVTMAVPDRIDLYLTAPIDHFLGARTESWLRVLLTHELTHFVHETYTRGIPHGAWSPGGFDETRRGST